MEDLRKDLQKITHDIMRTRSLYLEMMAAAYFKKTSVAPDEVELVEERKGNKFTWYFRKRDVKK